MKFVSPDQRGTTWRWTWSAIPAPATRPRFQPRLKPPGPVDASSVVDRGDGETVDLERLVVRQIGQRSDVAARRDHQVSGRVRVLVQERDRRVAACTRSDSSGGERAGRLVAEDAARPARPPAVMYSSRHGAHRGFVMTPFLPLLATTASQRRRLAAMASYGFKLAARRSPSCCSACSSSSSSTDLGQNRLGCGPDRRLRRAPRSSPGTSIARTRRSAPGSTSFRASELRARCAHSCSRWRSPGARRRRADGASGSAVVQRVGDGDTLDVRGGLRVRLVQIDAPELGEGECFARESKRELERLAPPGTSVELERDPDARRRRSLRTAPPLRRCARRET